MGNKNSAPKPPPTPYERRIQCCINGNLCDSVVRNDYTNSECDSTMARYCQTTGPNGPMLKGDPKCTQWFNKRKGSTTPEYMKLMGEICSGKWVDGERIQMCRGWCLNNPGKCDSNPTPGYGASEHCKGLANADSNNPLGVRGGLFCSCINPPYALSIEDAQKFVGISPKCILPECAAGKGYQNTNILNSKCEGKVINCDQQVVIQKTGITLAPTTVALGCDNQQPPAKATPRQMQSVMTSVDTFKVPDNLGPIHQIGIAVFIYILVIIMGYFMYTLGARSAPTPAKTT